MRPPGWLEWLLAGVVIVAGAAASALGVIPSQDALVVVAAAARNPYCTGPVIVLVLVWAESVRRLWPEAHRGWVRLAGAGVVVAATARIFLTLPEAAGDQWIARLYLAAALGTVIGAVALATFTLAAGLVPFRQLVTATVRWVWVFAPFVIFILAAGYGTAFIAHVRAEVADVRLLRMDESLGFHASMFFGSFDYVGSWLWDVQYVFYAGIGVLVMGVAGDLFLADDRMVLQRLLRSVILAGFLGWIGYWMLPAVGPTTAFPELFSGTTQERAAARSAAIARTEPMIQPPQFPRDCAPSLHTAWALIALLAAWRRPSFSWALPFGLLSIVTTLTLCKHYTADLIMAVPFALFCWWLAGDNRLNRAWRPFLVAVTGSAVAVAVWAVWAPLPLWLGWILAILCLVWPVHAWVQGALVSRASRGEASCACSAP